MRRRSINYHFSTFDMRFRDLRDGVKAQGHTVNDGFLAAISLGRRTTTRSLARRSMSFTSTCRLVHVARLRTQQNAVSIARFDLPTNFTDVNKLMDNLGQTVRKMRAPSQPWSTRISWGNKSLPAQKELLTQAAQASDVTASNVPGPPVTVYLAGERLKRWCRCLRPSGQPCSLHC